MNQIIKNDDAPLRPDTSINMPSMEIPGFRAALALQNKTHKNILLETYGGLGDVVCAMPTIDFALSNFKDCKFTIVTEHPYLFNHFKGKCRVVHSSMFDFTDVHSKYYVLKTLNDSNHLNWEFMIHMHVHCVDYTSMMVFRGCLPNKLKQIRLQPELSDHLHVGQILPVDIEKKIVIHPGKHWPSKTFPKWWWDAVLYRIKEHGLTPIIIGSDKVGNASTVDVDTSGCLDLRNKLSVMETVSLLMRSDVLLTNDSAPLHLAAATDAWIGFIATCKHPDFITHYRNGGEFGYKMRNLGLGGVWEGFDLCPNRDETVRVDVVPDEKLRSWLPDPRSVAEWSIHPH